MGVRRGFSAALCLAAVLLVPSGCGGGDEGGPDATKTEEVKKLDIDTNQNGDTVRGGTLIRTGTVSEPGATVKAGNETAKAKANGRFRLEVALVGFGEHELKVSASKSGFEDDQEIVVVTREQTAEERAAAEERRRLKREAELAELRASAEELDPERFQKDPDRY